MVHFPSCMLLNVPHAVKILHEKLKPGIKT